MLRCVVPFFFFFKLAHASCDNLSGQWRNELGSTIILNQREDNDDLVGSYLTAVEASNGAAGSGPHPIQGKLQRHTFAFAVSWTNSMTEWIGQCYQSDNGEDVLITSWILKANAETLDNEWMSKWIGEDKFYRSDIAKNG